MILNEVVVENFRQFRGRQTLTFSSDPKRNVTVVFGENGRGKTGIFRALMFCLYGNTILTQDDDASKAELYLVNTLAVDEAAAEGKPVTASVHVSFTHEGRAHEITRSVKAIRDGDTQHEQVDQVLMTFQDDGGNTKSERDPSVIMVTVDRILDSRMREYFLFDGERIEHLTRAGAQQRREVGRGIRSLLQIDSLERGIRALATLEKQFNAELAEVSTGEYAQVLASLKAAGEEIERIGGDIQLNEANQAEAEVERAKFEAMQQEDEEIRAVLQERDRLRQEKKDLEDEKRDLLTQMGERSSHSALLLAEDLLNEVYVDLNGRVARGEVPSQIRRDLIEQLLDNNTCICERPVTPGSPEFTALLSWKNQAVDETTENSAMNLWRLLSGLRDRSDDVRAFLETSIQTYADRRAAYEVRVGALETIGAQIGEDEGSDRAEIERARDGVERRIGGLQEQRLALDARLQEAQAAEARLKASRLELEKVEGRKGELQDRASLASSAEAALSSIRRQFVDDMRTQLSGEASAILELLLDEEGRRMLRGIAVQEDYSLQVLDPWKKPFLANISAGQRQMASLSFIMALARVAASGHTLEMPLFMDTPFGKLSWIHRRNLIDRIPELAAQWVLLATDTELGRREADRLLAGKAWGRFYQLVAQPDGSTRIEERPVDQAPLYLELEEAIS